MNRQINELMYEDHSCCRTNIPNVVENLFRPWVEGGMVIRLDIWHLLHRFCAEVQTDQATPRMKYSCLVFQAKEI